MYKKGIAIVLFFGCVCFAQNPDSAVAKGQNKPTLNVDFTFEKIPKSVQKGKSIIIENPNLIVTKKNKLNDVTWDNADKTRNTNAVFSVSPSGAATYAIPFSTPPGIKNIRPNLGLVFNSQSGNGLAGWGWNISGLSTLIRIPSTSFHDGIIDPIDFDKYDRFALDGQRLILKTGTYGADASVYQTENYSNLKIIAHGEDTEISGPSYFTVHYPDGSIAWYGKESAKGTLEWALQRKEDVHGNFITYEYLKNEGVLRIDKVNYGSNNSSQSINQVKFLYKERLRYTSNYIAGTLFKNTYILDQIKIFGIANRFFRSYKISHTTTSLNYQIVSSVTEYSKPQVHNEPIRFEYESTPKTELVKIATDYQMKPIYNTDSHHILAGDFNGDGKTDLVCHTRNFSKRLYFFDTLLTNSLDGNYFCVSTSEFEGAFTSNLLSSNGRLNNRQSISTVERTAASFSPIVFSYGWTHVSKSTPVNTATIKSYEIADNNSIQSTNTVFNGFPTYFFDELLPNSAPYDFQRSYHNYPMEYKSGDFNGDGITDVLVFPKEVVRVSYQNTFSPLTEVVKADEIYFMDLKETQNKSLVPVAVNDSNMEYEKIVVADFNGDGKSDVFIFNSGKICVYTLNSKYQLELIHCLYDSSIDLDYPVLFGDYNGDGNIDFIIPTEDKSSTWRCFISNGNTITVFSKIITYYKKSAYHPEPGTYTYYDGVNLENPLLEFRYTAQDVNRDGKTDILMHFIATSDSSSQSSERIEIYENKNDISTSSHPFKLTSRQYFCNSGVKKFGIPLTFEIKNNTSNSEYVYICSNQIQAYEFPKSHVEETNLKKIINNGISMDIMYSKPNNQNAHSEIYTKDHSEIYPYINSNRIPFLALVSKVVQSTSETKLTQEFKYEGLVHHIGGLGALGFKILKRSNWYGQGVQPLWNISKHSPQYRGALLAKWLATDDANYVSDYIQQTSYTYNTSLYANPSSELYPNAPLPHEIIQNEVIDDSMVDKATWRILLQPGFHVKATDTVKYHARITEQDDVENPGANGYAGVFKRTLKSSATHNALKGIYTTNQYTYTDYHKPKEIKTTFPEGYTIKTFTYFNNPSAVGHDYYIGRLEKYAEKKVLGKESFNTTTKFSYKNNLTKTQKRKGQGTEWICEDYTYDTFGNLLTKTLKTNGMTDRTERFEYDGSGRFLIKSSSMEGLTTTYTYDYFNGNQLSMKNPYGLTTSYNYDAWGRMKGETNYLNQKTTYAYEATSIDGDWRLEKTIKSPDGGRVVSYYNALGWLLKTKAIALNEKEVFKEFEYDAIGRKVRESEPYFDSPKHWNQWAYDHYGRLQSQSSFTGRVVTSEYEGLQTTVDDGDKSVTSIQDALGNVTQITDPGGTLQYVYHANGSLKETVYGDHVVSTEIDGWGRKIKLSDPSAGIYTYGYNGFGEITAETTPLGETTFTYDATGKLIEKSIEGELTDLTLSYTYNSDSKLLQEIAGYDGIEDVTYNYAYTYDSYMRPLKIKEMTAQAYFEKTLKYDSLGRIKQVAYHSLHHASTLTADQEILYMYDSNGIMGELKDANSQASLWKITHENERGQATNITFGNGMTRENTFDSFGFLQSIRDGTEGTMALELNYVFDVYTGNLNQRTNLSFEDWTENFIYDDQNRLTETKGATTHSQSYDLSGKIQENSRVGTYNYRGDKQYQLLEIDLNAQGDSYYQNHAPQTITYNAFKKPLQIQQAEKGRVDFTYGPLLNRTHAFYGGLQEEKTERRYHKLYSSLFPIEIIEDRDKNTVKTISYIHGDAYTAPIAHIKTSDFSSNGLFYLHRDYLGSILAISDTQGTIVEQRQFGPWGRVDQFEAFNGNNFFDHSALIGRGYTGHEHFFEVDLIHMNGRMYDANLGRFLSPDNY
ncbi:MAG: FG-GAP-like repeat-containing protein, partial [Flavicella sp.]